MSNALEDIAPAFRAARDRWPDAPNMEAHYADLSRTFEENGSSLVELCLSFIEMVCKTIIIELGGTLPVSSTPTTTEILNSALDALGLRSERGSSALGTVISGHNKLAKGLSDMRRNEGSVAHGKDSFIDSLSQKHSRIYLLSADAIVSLILSRYEGLEPNILHTREKHERFNHHNETIDAGTVVTAKVDDEDGMLVLSFQSGLQGEDEGTNLRTAPSELLYYLDRQAYVDAIDALRGVTPTEVDEEVDDTEVEIEEPTATDEMETETPAETPDDQDTKNNFDFQTEYTGIYADKVNPLYEYIVHTLLNGNDEQATKIQSLTFTILNGMDELAVVDWSIRLSTRFAVRLFVKKLLLMFAIEGLGTFNTENVNGIVNWLAGQIEGGDL